MHSCRLDRLRELVPHEERASTAGLLDNTYDYIPALQVPDAAWISVPAPIPFHAVGAIFQSGGQGQVKLSCRRVSRCWTPRARTPCSSCRHLCWCAD